LVVQLAYTVGVSILALLLATSPERRLDVLGPAGRQVLGSYVFYAIWSSYLKKSKRVAATYPEQARTVLPAAKRATRGIFSVGPYKLDMSVADVQGLVELSPIEYAALSRGIVFAGEKDFHAPPARFLGYDWTIVIGVVGERIYKISSLLECEDAASEDKAFSVTCDYCRQQLGEPTKRKGPLLIWDVPDGNVILESHTSAPAYYVVLSLTSNAVREVPRVQEMAS
jgi:hypothetical protein